MRIPRIYQGVALSSGAEIPLDDRASQHLQKALRLGTGAPLVLFNGIGGEFEAEIVAATRRSVTVRVGPHRAIERESPLAIRLVQGICRREKMDLVIQKAVELGVSAVTPVVTEYCTARPPGERLATRARHWQGIIASACEQCGRNRLPALTETLSLAQWLLQSAGDRAATGAPCDRLVLDPRATRGLADLEPPGTDLTLLIGPEGGLSEAEVDLARRHGYTAIGLGPRILRTETAGLAALAAVQARWGDLGRTA